MTCCLSEHSRIASKGSWKEEKTELQSIYLTLCHIRTRSNICWKGVKTAFAFQANFHILALVHRAQQK